MSTSYSADISCELSAAEVAELLPGKIGLWKDDIWSGHLPDNTDVSVRGIDHRDPASDEFGVISIGFDGRTVEIPPNVTISGKVKKGMPLDVAVVGISDVLVEFRWQVRGSGVFEIGDLPCLVWQGNWTWYNPDPKFGFAKRLEGSTLRTPDDQWRALDGVPDWDIIRD